MYTLIIDGGATKADWCAFDGFSRLTARTGGMNLSTMPEAAVSDIVSGAVAALGLAPGSVSEVHFYAAGLLAGTPAAQTVSALLSGYFPYAEIECASDLLAAARAVCGRRPGIAAILGTGSNSCLYDGEMIVRNVRSGGFILGDEGGGARLGKLFLSDFIKGLVPEPLASAAASSFGLDYMSIVNKVYRGEAPSAYLGSFAPWILAHSGDGGYVDALIEANLLSFVRRALSQYDLKTWPVGFVGGFACACAPIIERIAAAEGFSVSAIVPTPLDRLVDFHLSDMREDRFSVQKPAAQ